MGIINREIKYTYCLIGFLAFVFAVSPRSALSQNEGSLFMLPDNYQAQILNPSFQSDKTIIALPGLAGFSFGTIGNFKMTDFVYTTRTGQTVYDLSRFSERGHPFNTNSIQLSLPLLYIGKPVKKGMLSFYLKERINTAIRFPIKTIAWIDNGNLPEEYQNFQSGYINFRMLSFHEIAFGYAGRLKDKLHFGVRGKLLLGTVSAQVNDWQYGVETSSGGELVRLSSSGTGQLSVPFSVIIDENEQIQNIETQNALANYFSVLNPGFAIDGGITIDISKRKQFSASIQDLGFINFGKNAWELYQNDVYEFRGVDISNSTNSRKGNGYVFPLYLMLDIKDSLRNVFKPSASPTQLFTGLSPQLNLHYRYKYTNNLFFGVTNHTVLQKSYLMNTLSFNALKQKGSFSFVGNLSLHQLSSLTFGGGVQWNTSFTQLFVFADNLMAFYHPAAQKSYALTFGMNFLLNNKNGEAEERKIDYSRRGKISKFLPFYKKYK